MQADPEFGQGMEETYRGLTESVAPGGRGAFPREAPSEQGLTWHHNATEPGVMELIPYEQHTAPGAVQRALHPNRRGGMEEWGGGRGRSRER